MPNYVVHFCHNAACNNAWLDKDKTYVTIYPPKWRYCQECRKIYGDSKPKTPEGLKKAYQALEEKRRCGKKAQK